MSRQHGDDQCRVLRPPGVKTDSDLGHEREAHSVYYCPHCNGHKDIERIEAECEVSGVTKVILKAYNMLE